MGMGSMLAYVVWVGWVAVLLGWHDNVAGLSDVQMQIA